LSFWDGNDAVDAQTAAPAAPAQAAQQPQMMAPIAPPAASQPQQPAQPDQLPVISTRAEAEALPAGTRFRSPDGSIYESTGPAPQPAAAQPAQEAQPARAEPLITDELLTAIDAPAFANNARRQELEREATELTFTDDQIRNAILDLAKGQGKVIGSTIKRAAEGMVNSFMEALNTINTPVEKLGNAVLNAGKSVLRDPMKSTAAERTYNRMYIAIEDILRKKYIAERIKEENAK
jgi:hypothetical protein